MFGWDKDGKENSKVFKFTYDDLSRALSKYFTLISSMGSFIETYPYYKYDSNIYFGKNIFILEFEIIKGEKGDKDKD